MKNFLTKMLSEGKNENISSKRVIGFSGFAVLIILIFVHLFWKVNPIPDWLSDAILFIVLSALFGSTIEKFSPNKKDQNEENKNQ